MLTYVIDEQEAEYSHRKNSLKFEQFVWLMENPSLAKGHSTK